jgi:hypothetical protein
VVYFIEQDRAMVESDGKTRVSATIFLEDEGPGAGDAVEMSVSAVSVTKSTVAAGVANG